MIPKSSTCARTREYHGPVHDIFLRAHAVLADKKKKRKRKAKATNGPKWPECALVFDTESRITEDQSLTFGVYHTCRLVDDSYTVTEEGIFHADELPAKEPRCSQRTYARLFPT
jgi:hypothetical protein